MKCLLRVISGRAGVPAEMAAHSQNLTYIIMARVRFGDKYKQWNAAFDAGFASALNKPLITLHDPDLTHPLKEVDASALAVAETPEQVVRLLVYAINGEL